MGPNYIQIGGASQLTQLFGKGGNKARWKAEYDNTIYKIYDWQGNLAGYFFPHYTEIESEEQEEDMIEGLTKAHASVSEGTLLLPMVKLGLLDNHGGMDVDYVITSLATNSERAKEWKIWLGNNSKEYGIFGAQVHTAREDRNMLSIAIGMVATIKLGEKEVRDYLLPLLDKLHKDGLL